MFNRDLMESLKTGKMRATTRTDKLAEPGDVFFYKKRKFEITKVYQKEFMDAVQSDFEINGFDTPTQMAMTISSYYPKLKPNTMMYVHEFREVKA